jgi:hypothetical protein
MTGKHIMILAYVLILSGCATNTLVCNTVGLPPRPLLEPVTQELWVEIPRHTQSIISSNDAALKAYSKQLEGRIKIHDESCSEL